jgi:hypothetical protein
VVLVEGSPVLLPVVVSVPLKGARSVLPHAFAIAAASASSPGR